MKYPQEGWFSSWNLSCLRKLWVIMCFSGVLLIKSKMTEQTLLMRSMSIKWNSSSLRQGNLRKSHKNLQFEYLILNQYLTIILAKNSNVNLFIRNNMCFIHLYRLMWRDQALIKDEYFQIHYWIPWDTTENMCCKSTLWTRQSICATGNCE